MLSALDTSWCAYLRSSIATLVPPKRATSVGGMPRDRTRLRSVHEEGRTSFPERPAHDETEYAQLDHSASIRTSFGGPPSPQ